MGRTPLGDVLFAGGAPHIDVKVERFQRVILDEMFVTLDIELSLEKYSRELEIWIKMTTGIVFMGR